MAQMYASDPYSLVIRVYLLCTLVAITFMYTSAIAVYMAKLYWRIKVNQKWTWVAFTKANSTVDFSSPSGWSYSNNSKEEEE